ncbi:acetyl-CoA acetyltransferase, cytosolic 1-like protein [Tanacetum coccineum]
MLMEMEGCVTRALSLKAFMSLEHCSPSRLQKSSNSDLVPDTTIVQRNLAANGEELIKVKQAATEAKDAFRGRSFWSIAESSRMGVSFDLQTFIPCALVLKLYTQALTSFDLQTLILCARVLKLYTQPLTFAKIAPPHSKDINIDHRHFNNILSLPGQGPARQAALGARIPNTMVSTSVNKVCALGLKEVKVNIFSPSA